MSSTASFHDEADHLVDTREAARLLGVAYQTMVNARVYGGGAAVPFIKIGRTVRYSTHAIARHKLTRTHTCTSGYASA